ncbi:MAG TPA: phage protein Gp27 family protein, partial [Luteimonas sp.]|nr:phage protein Gp27 family protein [Luteimonas sp.]
DPEGDVGRLLSEMLRTVAWQTIGSMGETDAVAPNEIMLLARAIKDLAAADKVAMERELKIRQEVARQAADAATKIAKRGGLSADAVQEIRREILGVAK